MQVRFREDARFGLGEAALSSVLVLLSGFVLPLGAWLFLLLVWTVLGALFVKPLLASRHLTYVEIDDFSVSWPGHRVDRSQVVEVNDSPGVVEFVLSSGERVPLDLTPLRRRDRSQVVRVLAPTAGHG